MAFIKLTIWDFANREWTQGHVRAASIERVFMGDRDTPRGVDGAESEVSTVNAVLYVKESPAEVMERIARIERSQSDDE